MIKLSSSAFVEVGIGIVDDDESEVVASIRRLVVPNIADDPFVNVEEDDGIRCCCWATATDESNEIMDNNEINIDVRFE